ncbi:Hsp20/alpha crystallin family protein, partial [Ralstonia pseudosolanacearum]
LHEPLTGFGGLDRWFGDFSSSRFQPRIDVVDDGTALRITAELPGMDREEVQMTIEDGALVLRGEKKQDIRSEENGCYRLERAYGAFMRSIPLPEGLDLDHIEARFERGLLTLRLPKSSSPPPPVRKIEVT